MNRVWIHLVAMAILSTEPATVYLIVSGYYCKISVHQ